MRKNLKYVVVFLLGCLVIISCSKKKETTNPLDFPYANETVDQGKANLQSSGEEMVTEMTKFESVDGLKVISNFNDNLNADDPTSTLKSSPLLAPATKSNKLTSKDMFGYLRAGLKESDDTTLQQEFDRYKGIYTWNIATKVWVKTTSTDKIEFDFPSTKTGTANNAKIVITYTGIKGISIITNYKGDMPANFNTSLYVNDSKIAEYDLTCAYNTDGTPSSVVYFAAIYPFKFQVSLTYNATSASIKYSFTDDSKIIVECYAGVNGKLDKTSIENVQNNTSLNATDIVNNANAYFQVMNIKLAGQIAYKGWYDDAMLIDGNLRYTSAQRDSASAVAINKNMLLVLVYADTKQKIAQAEAYCDTRTYTWYDYYDNPYTETESYVDMRFVFADKSKGNLEDYFSTGFQNLVSDINALIIKLNGDFNGNIQPVVY